MMRVSLRLVDRAISRVGYGARSYRSTASVEGSHAWNISREEIRVLVFRNAFGTPRLWAGARPVSRTTPRRGGMQGQPQIFPRPRMSAGFLFGRCAVSNGFRGERSLPGTWPAPFSASQWPGVCVQPIRNRFCSCAGDKTGRRIIMRTVDRLAGDSAKRCVGHRIAGSDASISRLETRTALR